MSARAFRPFFGLAIPTLGIQVRRQVVVASRRVLMFLSQLFAEPLKDLAVDCFGLGVLSLRIQVNGQIVGGDEGVGVFLPLQFAQECQSLAKAAFGLAILTLRASG